MQPRRVPSTFGAVWDGSGTTFRVRSEHATGVALHVALPTGEEYHPLVREDAVTWSTHLPGCGPGTHYGYRVSGPWSPEQGHLFNPRKLLLDPWARMVSGPVRWHPSLQVAAAAPRGTSRPPASADSAAHMPRSVVVAPAAPPVARPGRTAWRDAVIYECHVKGMTALHPEVPPRQRGTYLGLASEPILQHLRSLGVTAVELLPVQPASDSAHVVRNGLTNYWGYATVAFFSPDRRFATVPGQEVEEFRTMVERFHAAGIDVLLDVVFNHTGEGGIDGCTAAFRGFDNASWYRLHPDGSYEDFTGTGNTLDFRREHVREFVRDCLGFWVRDMGVDGFRFDLAPAMGRNRDDDPAMPFLEELAADPGLSGVHLIAEPWDLGPDGYRQGRFPRGWAEWNGRYRDDVRRFWRGDGGVGPLATRISGSSDLFGPTARTPLDSVNFITCHDGFTLHDLVSYARKHNVANGEGNRDGADWNESQYLGAEGPVADAGINEARIRVMRGMLATLALSLGVPMLSHGDEFGRTQSGNNNPWCQDNAVSWMPWLSTPGPARMLAFTREVLALRRRYGVFRRNAFLHLHDLHGIEARARWLRQDGLEMSPEDWDDDAARLLAVILRSGTPEGRHVAILLAFNSGGSDARLELPVLPAPSRWQQLLDTAHWPAAGAPDGFVTVPSRSVVLLEADDPAG